MEDNNTEVIKQPDNNEKKLTGFQLHPENINRNGRPPKGHSITETIQAMMDEKPEIKRALGQRILQMALEGDLAAIRTIWGYIDGLPAQATDVTTGGERLEGLVIVKDGSETK
jgi:hypothetical protein